MIEILEQKKIGEKKRHGNKIINYVRFWQNGKMFFLKYHSVWTQRESAAKKEYRIPMHSISSQTAKA